MSIRELSVEEVRTPASQLLELQPAAYAAEAALIGDDRIPPLHETVSDLRAARLEWIASFDAEQITGAVGYAIDDDVVDLDARPDDRSHHCVARGRVRRALQDGTHDQGLQDAVGCVPAPERE